MSDPIVSFVDNLLHAPHGNIQFWRDDRRFVVGRFLGLDLGSVFQPVRCAGTGRSVGHEAFIRTHEASGTGLSPWTLFSHAASDDQLIDLDRTCRTVHSIRYFASRPARGVLFLNVHGRLVLAVREDHGRTFRGILSSLAIDSGRIVIETPEPLTEHVTLLARVHDNYRRNGFRTAVNLRSASQAPELLGHCVADYLKIDAKRLHSPEELGWLSEQAHRCGAAVIVKRIGNDKELAAVRDAGADYVQGYALDDEAPACQPAELDPPRIRSSHNSPGRDSCALREYTNGAAHPSSKLSLVRLGQWWNNSI